MATGFVQADNATIYQSQLESLLSSNETPEGVVFEIIDRDKLFLNWALPEVEKQAKHLRQRFPDLDIVIVSHGQEMFALTRTNQSENPLLKSQLDILKSQDIQVHVCGTYAGWRGLDESAFPDNVDVAAEGPAQINDYIKLGYVHIKVARQKM